MIKFIPMVSRLQTSLLFKFFLLILILILTCSDLLAQRGNNHIVIGGELGPVITDRYHGYQFGVGFPFKAYFGTGNQGQLIFRSGMHYLWVPSGDLYEPTRSVVAYLMPLTLG